MWCSSLWVSKGSQRILSQLVPLPGPGAADLHKFPDPGATSDSGVSRWSQRLSLAWLSVQALQRFLHWPLLCDKLLCCHPRHLLTQHCPQNPLPNIPFIFLEFCSRRMLHQFSMSKKNLKAFPVVLLSPMKLNYSSSFAGNANVIADFLNKQLHHYNNHQDFYYFWPYPQQIKSINLQSGMGNCNFFLQTS